MESFRRFDFLFGIAVIVFLLVWNITISSSRKNFVNCSSNVSYKEIYKAYKDGNTSLDKNKDGIPCNDRYNKNK